MPSGIIPSLKFFHDKICFLGKQEDFVRILQCSDLFLLPSESESFGLAALEAMSCGVPVVGSNVQGIPEVVIHGETGFLSQVGDVESMAKHSLELLNNESKQREFAKSSRERVLSEFAVESVVDLYEDYYYRILDEASE